MHLRYYGWVHHLARFFTVLLAPLVLSTTLAQGVLSAPRSAKREGFTRVVLDLPPNTPYLLTYLPDGIQIRLTGMQAAPLSGTLNAADVQSWSYAADADGVTVRFKTPFPVNDQRGLKFLPLPPSEDSTQLRLVLDFSPGMLRIDPFQPQPLPVFPLNTQIVLDPGHGGSDPGAVGGVVEKEVTLQVAQMVRDHLTQAGAQVTLTRNADVDLSPIKDRDLRARAAMGKPPQQYFVSIHVNSDTAGNGAGIETWYYTPQSKTFADALQRRMIEMTAHTSRGVKRAPFVVIKEPYIPAALVEVGFASHPLDSENLRNPIHLQRIAYGIAQAIRDQYPTLPSLAPVTPPEPSIPLPTTPLETPDPSVPLDPDFEHGQM
ncbi:N-acetylmuramoyl-L-alanine amidase family protein [Deinococcus cellulosilyticus]|uniref:MurNAc-LAA domain-containing protein n=1 Tax=Deinococcus cellulosilyticus (strain DSM 18568 / NBRC 106333 / KACC 11606 / 5516J-15) TaxID=1223518 RepID=A0A511N0P0_DEIC1|nr:N-acetylmuramoyl-L-alanine amidase [Deinococcus cellulosilyticus]GEM46445.1 hypothetical protein DC3_20800 [Deinococcus cellulosilyticus NBRC 106333 = KACC 11606]